MAAGRQRSAVGVGVSTLITVLVVLLLATFSILSLVSARSDLQLSRMATSSAQDFYAADSQATRWYAELDTFCAANASNDLRRALQEKGYELLESSSDALVVTKAFAVGEKRQLTVSIAVTADGSTTIRQWQTATVIQ
ncbi:MAG: hypothetical protein LBP28_04360 [Coriobacteriales bacterium]|jgi:hypothetical protein|nr:hypothetical protein [Coriobacteriales bacterium]